MEAIQAANFVTEWTNNRLKSVYQLIEETAKGNIDVKRESKPNTQCIIQFKLTQEEVAELVSNGFVVENDDHIKWGHLL